MYTLTILTVILKLLPMITWMGYDIRWVETDTYSNCQLQRATAA